MSSPDHKQRHMHDNLLKSCAITNAVFALKVAWEQASHPELSRYEIERRVRAGILERKERQWTLAKD